MDNGKPVVFKNIPSRKNNVDELLSIFEDDAYTGFVRHVTVFHIDNEPAAMKLKEKVLEMTHVDVSVMPSSPIPDCDAGVGSLGLAWNVV